MTAASSSRARIVCRTSHRVVGGSYTAERTYQNLIGPLDDPTPKVWAECLFADPVGDIAVLGSPDGQELFNEAEAYEALTENVPSLRIGDIADVDLTADDLDSEPAWLLTLDGRWAECMVTAFPRALWIENAVEGIRGGMSGSPILTGDASAIGIVCLSGGGLDEDSHTEGGPNPRLTHNLPGWLLRSLGLMGEAKIRAVHHVESERSLRRK